MTASTPKFSRPGISQRRISHEPVADLAGDTARSATSDEVKALRRESSDLKEALADLTLENRLLKKSMIADGGDDE